MLIDETLKIDSIQKRSEYTRREEAHEAAVIRQGKALLQKKALDELLGIQLTRRERLRLQEVSDHG